MAFNWLRKLLLGDPEKAAAKAIMKTKAFAVLSFVSNEIFNDKSKGLGTIANEHLKRKLLEDNIKLLGTVLTSPDPMLTNREIICDGIAKKAMFYVLIAEKEFQGKSNMALKGVPIVSGELKDHIMDIAEKDKDIKDLCRGIEDIEQSDLYDGCVMGYWMKDLQVKIFSTIRMAKEEVNDLFTLQNV